MKHVKLLLTVLLLGLLGCSDASLVGTEPDDADQAAEAVSMAKKGVKYVPFELVRTRSSTLLLVEPPDDVFPFDLGIGCVPDLMEAWLLTDGQQKHMGAVKTYTNMCIDIGPESWTLVGKVVWVAANRDQMWLDFTAECTPACAEYTAYLTVTGGTGRFENASTPPGEPLYEVNGEITGRISSVGSSK